MDCWRLPPCSSPEWKGFPEGCAESGQGHSSVRCQVPRGPSREPLVGKEGGDSLENMQVDPLELAHTQSIWSTKQQFVVRVFYCK